MPEWNEAVVVSKNPGGSKRVTSLADVLKLNFGIITTDRRRSPLMGSMIFDSNGIFGNGLDNVHAVDTKVSLDDAGPAMNGCSTDVDNNALTSRASQSRDQANDTLRPTPIATRNLNGNIRASPLARSTRVESVSPPTSRRRPQRSQTLPTRTRNLDNEDSTDEYTDERARDVITGRLIQGHIVDDDFPSPILSTMSGSTANLVGEPNGPAQFDERDFMTSSIISTVSSFQPDPLGGSFDAAASDEEDEGLKNPELEHTITLVGNVNDKIVFIIDDMIDGCSSWIAAAETVVKRGGAKKVYCIATHGLFGGDSLENMEACECIDFILVSNTFPIEPEKIRASKKLVVLDLSGLLAEAIRRNHYGESISQLYQNFQD